MPLLFIVAALGYWMYVSGHILHIADTISVAFGLDEQMDNAVDMQEMVQIQLQRQAVTAIATVVAGGAQATIATGVNKTLNSMNTEEENKKS